MRDEIRCSIELREAEAEAGPTLHGVVLQEGRAAQGGRAEVFAPLSVVWPSNGVARSWANTAGLPQLARAVPTRDATMVRSESRPRQPRRSSKPLQPASTSLLSFTRSKR